MKLTLTNGLILGAIFYIGLRTYQGKPVVPDNLDLNPFDNDLSPTPPPAGTTFPLGRGSRGAYVKALQKHLGISADGVFGVQTENALRARHGKSTVDSLSELNSWIGAAGVAAAATKPVVAKPVAVPAKPVTGDPYSSFPLKRGSTGQYVRNLQQWLGLKIDGQFGVATEAALYKRTGQKVVDSLEQLNQFLGKATPAAPAKPAAPKPTAAPAARPDWSELDKVFRAFWTILPNHTNVVELRTFADKDALLAVLGNKTDAQLKAFIVQYNLAYRKWKGVNVSRPNPSLAGDFAKLTIIGGSALAALRDKIGRLSMKR